MKKKLLAGILSFTMLAGQVLPVVAADDVDVAVSENETVVEESAEEAAEETTASEDAVEAEVVSDTVVEDFGPCIAYEEKVISDENGEQVLDCYAYYLVNFNEDGTISAVSPDDISTEDEEVLKAVNSSIYAINDGGNKTIDAGSFEVDGKSYALKTNFVFNNYISYRGKKLKATDLNIMVSESGLYNIASDLATPGSAIPYDLIKWKYTLKKNKDANSGSYFTVKATVNTKIAKNLGIKGKALSSLKKAAKAFSKVSKKEQIAFNIDPVVFDYMLQCGNGIIVENSIIHKSWLGFVTSVDFKGISIHCRIRPDQPDIDMCFDSKGSAIKKYFKKLTKPTKKDVEVKKIESRKYSITPMNKNYYGKNSYIYTVQGSYSNLK